MVEEEANLYEQGFRAVIENLEIEADKALLFDKKYIVWGELDLELRRRDNSTEMFIAYEDKILGMATQAEQE